MEFKFKDILRQSRNELGIKQSELAEKVGISFKSISCYELGTREPKIATLVKLADIFDMTLDELVGRVRQEGNQMPAIDVHDIKEQKLIDSYRTLSKEDMERVDKIIHNIYDAKKLDTEEQKLIDLYRTLSKADMKRVDKIVQALAEFSPIQKKDRHNAGSAREKNESAG